MSRHVGWRVFTVALLAFGWVCPLTLASPQRGEAPRPPQPLPSRSGSPELEARFRQFLAASGIAGPSQEEEIATYRRMPADLQDLVVATTMVWKSPAAKWYRKIDPGTIRPLAIPTVDSFWPASDGPMDWVFVTGQNFRSTSEVYFRGAKAYSFYLGSALMFQLPSTATPAGTSGEVMVKNGVISSTAVQYPLVAPRSYRGLWGWKFANAGHPQIPWAVYRNYFGPSNVEFADGTHRPSAQSWYDYSYKGVGGGGNCYGMSLSSLRLKHGNLGGLLFASWFAANPQPDTWEYTSNRNNDQVWQTIQEMQGNQLAEPQHTLLWTRIGSQNPNGSWLSAQSITSNWNNAPHGCVMAMIGGGGHATVPYNVREGSTRNIFHYDNNAPYQTFESGGPDVSVANVNKAANTFSYGGYNQVAIFDLPELLVTPHLPAGVGASMGEINASSRLVVDKPGTVTQITDEKGNTFYANGQVNTGANRIPGAYYTPPIMGGPVPDSYPHTWLFTNSTAKSFTVQVSGLRPESRALFLQAGRQIELHAAAGTLNFTLSGINSPAGKLILNNPGVARVESVKLIDIPVADEERTFEIRNFSPQLDKPLEIGLSADRAALEIVNQSARAVPLQVTLRADRANSHVGTRALTVNLSGSQKGILRTPNWRGLTGQDLQLETQSLNGVRIGITPIRP